jgi:hypothetical protein
LQKRGMPEKLNESTVTLETREGSMEAFQVIPHGEMPAPAVIIAQEAFGVNTHRVMSRSHRICITATAACSASPTMTPSVASLSLP